MAIIANEKVDHPSLYKTGIRRSRDQYQSSKSMIDVAQLIDVRDVIVAQSSVA